MISGDGTDAAGKGATANVSGMLSIASVDRIGDNSISVSAAEVDTQHPHVGDNRPRVIPPCVPYPRLTDNHPQVNTPVASVQYPHFKDRTITVHATSITRRIQAYAESTCNELYMTHLDCINNPL